MKKYNLGILGATGAVGQEMVKILEEKSFPINNLVLLASKKSEGRIIKYKGQKVIVENTSSDSFKNLDIVLGATPSSIAEKYSNNILNSGAVFIDNSSAFRLNDDVPLIIPEINPDDISKHKGIISNPNCSTIITLVAANAVNKLSRIDSMVVSTYQATSGVGSKGPNELRFQESAIINNESIHKDVFPYQIAENLIPQIGAFTYNGYTTEELKMQNEGRKILHNNELKVSCTCVRVPVIRSHSISALLITENKLNLSDIKNAISNEMGCILYDCIDEEKYPMPIISSNCDKVYVGRIREDLVFKNGISIWCCGDQIRKGAALNAVQIAELLIK